MTIAVLSPSGKTNEVTNRRNAARMRKLGSKVAIAIVDTHYESSDQVVILILIKYPVWAKLIS